ncbi:hypothetical protein [Lapillicoccus sp.]|uniref:hypothetical protein n=1 Tax=Lapillicoccus sp. TaxID=1909287 RepID=UPI003266FDB7
MIRTEPEMDLEDLRVVQVPTLVLQGDRDEVTVEHSLAVVEALPGLRRVGRRERDSRTGRLSWRRCDIGA